MQVITFYFLYYNKSEISNQEEKLQFLEHL